MTISTHKISPLPFSLNYSLSEEFKRPLNRSQNINNFSNYPSSNCFNVNKAVSTDSSREKNLSDFYGTNKCELINKNMIYSLPQIKVTKKRKKFPCINACDYNFTVPQTNNVNISNSLLIKKLSDAKNKNLYNLYSSTDNSTASNSIVNKKKVTMFKAIKQKLKFFTSEYEYPSQFQSTNNLTSNTNNDEYLNKESEEESPRKKNDNKYTNLENYMKEKFYSEVDSKMREKYKNHEFYKDLSLKDKIIKMKKVQIFWNGIIDFCGPIISVKRYQMAKKIFAQNKFRSSSVQWRNKINNKEDNNIINSNNIYSRNYIKSFNDNYNQNNDKVNINSFNNYTNYKSNENIKNIRSNTINAINKKYKNGYDNHLLYTNFGMSDFRFRLKKENDNKIKRFLDINRAYRIGG